MYDSLSRLIRAQQSEQSVRSSLNLSDPVTNTASGAWLTITMTNGSLSHKTDARGVITTYLYDALNRNYSIAYANDPVNTPSRHARLRQPNQWRVWQRPALVDANVRRYAGRYWQLRCARQAEESATAVSITTVPGASRIPISSITYDLAVMSWRKLSFGPECVFSYDTRAGRTASAALSVTARRALIRAELFTMRNRMSKEQFGTSTPIYNKLFYNSRGQLSEIREGLTANDSSWQRGAIINHYTDQPNCWGVTCNASDNNGNLRNQECIFPTSIVNNGIASLYQLVAALHL